MPWGIVAGAAIGAIGSGIASSQQAGAQEQAAATQQNMFNTIVGQEQPFIQPGYAAEATLSQLMGLPSSGYSGAPSTGANAGGWTMGGDGRMMQLFPPTTSAAPPSGAGGTVGTTGLPAGFLTETFNPTQAQLEQYPGYQFQRDQGNLALQSAASAGGSALSGPALKSLMSFNQGLAASNYNNYFNQFQTQQNNIFNRLNSIATMGQNAAGNLGTAGTQLGTGIAQAQAAAGASIAGGIAGGANNIGQAITLSSLLKNNNNTPSSGSGDTVSGAGNTMYGD